ncbi:hypothetical protein SDC9_55072 [bioreactor metagenome]|uniref:Uncharacterized protein n=1 Tax=bioreactor metagenome TaxID=1076179 RepID=A0A644WXX6_9ZZZZ
MQADRKKQQAERDKRGIVCKRSRQLKAGRNQRRKEQHGLELFNAAERKPADEYVHEVVRCAPKNEHQRDRQAEQTAKAETKRGRQVADRQVGGGTRPRVEFQHAHGGDEVGVLIIIRQRPVFVVGEKVVPFRHVHARLAVQPDRHEVAVGDAERALEMVLFIRAVGKPGDDDIEQTNQQRNQQEVAGKVVPDEKRKEERSGNQQHRDNRNRYISRSSARGEEMQQRRSRSGHHHPKEQDNEQRPEFLLLKECAHGGNVSSMTVQYSSKFSFTDGRSSFILAVFTGFASNVTKQLLHTAGKTATNGESFSPSERMRAVPARVSARARSRFSIPWRR